MKPKSKFQFNPESIPDDQLVIILIRHGEPDIKYKKWYSHSEMYDHDTQYHESSVKPFGKFPLELRLPIKKFITAL